MPIIIRSDPEDQKLTFMFENSILQSCQGSADRIAAFAAVDQFIPGQRTLKHIRISAAFATAGGKAVSETDDFRNIFFSSKTTAERCKKGKKSGDFLFHQKTPFMDHY